jgi:malonyl-CoA/methylmalonyl-CoA synthetase
MQNPLETSLLRLISREEIQSNIAILDADPKKALTYAELNSRATDLALAISAPGRLPADCHTVAGFHPPGVGYVVSLLATWKLGRRFLPLCPTHPRHEIEYFLRDSRTGFLLYAPDSPSFITSMTQTDGSPISALLVNDSPVVADPPRGSQSESAAIIAANEAKNCDQLTGGLILYTSGTTGAPKGVLHSQSGLAHMVMGLCAEWEYAPTDRLPHCLPLHHLHGVLNKLICVLASGGAVRFLPSAQASQLWRSLATEQDLPPSDRATLFMGVPTIYARLIEEARRSAHTAGIPLGDLRTLSPERVAHFTATPAAGSEKSASSPAVPLAILSAALRTVTGLRLTVCGSAALPDPVLDAWQELTGQTLLERYGMTEVGMAMTNPLRGERVRGAIGHPLPFVDARIVGENEETISAIDTPGELRLKVVTNSFFQSIYE